MPSSVMRISSGPPGRPACPSPAEPMATRPVRIGLIGAGAIARCHVHGYLVHDTTFGNDSGSPVLEAVAEATPELAVKAAAWFGFRHAAPDWRAVIESRDIDVVDIC